MPTAAPSLAADSAVATRSRWALNWIAESTDIEASTTITRTAAGMSSSALPRSAWRRSTTVTVSFEAGAERVHHVAMATVHHEPVRPPADEGQRDRRHAVGDLGGDDGTPLAPVAASRHPRPARIQASPGERVGRSL